MAAPRDRSRSLPPGSAKAHWATGWVRPPDSRWGAPLSTPLRLGFGRPNPAPPVWAGGSGRLGPDTRKLGSGTPAPQDLPLELPCPLRGPCALHPNLLVQSRTAVPALSLEGVEGWVWGRGRVWGRTRRRGCLCGRAQFGSPGLSLSLLLPPPAPGGARHGGAGARQARYGDVETGEASCGEVVMGGTRGREDWRGERRRHPG